MSENPRRILIVDDELVNRKLLRTVLKSEPANYDISEAPTGEDALKAVNASPPDIVLLDVMMPGIDGYETCKRLKSKKETSSIPVLFISAMDKTAEKVAGFKAGGSDYITKPINPEEVKARVAAHLRIKGAEEERADAENLRTVKDMIATYNHNMNQPLMVMYTYINTALMTAGEDEKKRKVLEKIKKELDKVNAILQKIQAIEEVRRTEYVGGSGMLDLGLEGDKG